MKLKEAFPKPGQAPLGGVSSEMSKINVPGYGTMAYGTLKNSLKRSLEHCLDRIEKYQLHNMEHAVYKEIKSEFDIIRIFIDALDKFVDDSAKQQGK